MIVEGLQKMCSVQVPHFHHNHVISLQCLILLVSKLESNIYDVAASPVGNKSLEECDSSAAVEASQKVLCGGNSASSCTSLAVEARNQIEFFNITYPFDTLVS